MKIAILIRAGTDWQYVAHCPSLPGCVASACTRESAAHKMREAVTGYLASPDLSLPPRTMAIEAEKTVFR